jgi:hypothetical protein
MQDFLRKKSIVATSAYLEMLSSLHVLHRPEHHSYRVEWAQQTLQQLPDQFKKQLREYGEITDEWLSLMDAESPSISTRSIQEGIDNIRNLPDAEFLVLLYNQRFSLSTIISWLSDTDDGWKKALSENERKALKHPGRIRRMIANFLDEYHRIYFYAEWRRIEPWLVRAERTFLEKLARSPEKALGELHPRLLVKKDGLYAQKATLYRFPYEEIKTIIVRPSTFVYPHLMLNLFGGVRVPPTVFPFWAKLLAAFFPVTYALYLVREALSGEISIFWWWMFLCLVLIDMLLVAATFWILSRAERYSRKHGSWTMF